MKTIQLLLFLFVSAPMLAQTTLITADRLFDGQQMHDNWGVLVENDLIKAVGPIKSLQGKGDQTLHLEGHTLMPGMIEGHSHVLLYPYDQRNWNDQVLKESRSLRAIRGAKMATANLMAGFTTIRDLGSEGAEYADVAIKESIELGIVDGPRMLVAGPAIVATGSYGPKGFIPDMEMHLGAQPADGDDLIRVTREQIGKGADFIKVYADYRWGPNGESQPTFTLEELKTIVEVANSSGRVVVAHASTPEGMRRATLAGVSTIEHGTNATKEVLELMKEHNVALCPTLAAGYSISRYQGWDGSGKTEPERVKSQKAMFKMAMEVGVPIVAGGDVGVFSHGRNALEMVLMQEYGMSAKEVLQTVTAKNAERLNLPRLGKIQEGFLADIIAVKGDPVKDINNLYQVDFVMKNGKVYKNQ